MPDEDISDYRFGKAKRKNNPPAGLAPEGRIKESPKVTFDYKPHLPPTLRFDPSGQSDKLPELLAKARLGPNDCRIAASAIVHGYTVVTCNGKDFSRIPGATFEDWSL